MANRNRQSTMWFWLLLVALVVVVVVGIRAVVTSEECDDRPTSWSWMPPGFECPSRP